MARGSIIHLSQPGLNGGKMDSSEGAKAPSFFMCVVSLDKLFISQLTEINREWNDAERE